MKTLDTLEQEAKQAREEAIKEVSQYVPNAIEVADKLILAAVAMMTYQFALAGEDLGCKQNIQITGDGSGHPLPEVSQDQKEVDADGWISWSGGSCPVNKNEIVDLKFGSGHIRYGTDTKYKWEGTGARDCDIVAYRVAKAYPCKLPDNGWIAWNGGVCPVDSDCFVEVKLRSFGDITGSGLASSIDWSWSAEKNADDIIAYRISKGE